MLFASYNYSNIFTVTEVENVKKIKISLIISIIFLVCFTAMAIDNPYSAVSLCLYDATDEKIIYAYNENKKMAPASITKILTCITALENEKIYRSITVDKKSPYTEGTSIYLKSGEKLRMIQLLYGLMLNSGNDAANTVANYFGKEKFVKMMNDTAKKAGVASSNFENPSGLDGKEHLVTAYDMAKITSYALKNEDFVKIVSTKEVTIKNSEGVQRNLKNHNKLLWYSDNIIGVKTGFTKKAGRTLVSAVRYGGKVYVCVTLKDPNDWEDHKKIYNTYVFKNNISK